MDNKTFYILFSEAIEDSDRDVFVSDWALSSVFPEESDPGEFQSTPPRGGRQQKRTS